ncbi:sensor histidine kinase [Vineibacter terrae]|uniref:histidine kinase n=1 Tax=Vineibacter terrae TaxID=2586908 RepID=A0A5C8PHM4_9HYPH|nr:sensor histidine kinase [Vineibacter terrae]TXL73320.1 sensor histidine kinase [Vineibacter terrae]
MTLRARLFLLTAAALAPGLVLALLTVVASWPGAILAVLVYAAALAVFCIVIDRWCRTAPAAAAPAAPAPSAPPEAAPSPPAPVAMQALQADLAQRDALLRELHHRVKNNLQMISSLLSLQAGRIRSPRIRRVFAGAQNRVLTMSLLHRHLYERTNWTQVDFQAFLNDLVRHLSVGDSAPAGPGVRFTVSAPVMAVGPDVAIPVGLIVTEAVSNALAHAFADVAEPRVTIQVIDRDGQFELLIEDDGVGIADGDDDLADGGLGFTLLRGLSAQLGGEASVSRRAEGGTSVRVRFPNPVPAPDVSAAADR